MANLYSGYVTFNGYVTLTSLTNVTFSEGTTYTIQIQPAFNDKIMVREGTTGQGFIVGDQPFQYIAGTSDLYIGRMSSSGASNVYVNIAN